MASQPLDITTDFSKGVSDGDLRIINGFLERYDAFTKTWILPDQWFVEKTGTEPIDNFGAGHLWDCYYNIYSTGCFSSMSRVFGLGQAGELLLQDYYMQTSWSDLFVLIFFGLPILGNWLFMNMWLILFWPDDFLPPEKDSAYTNVDVMTWLWYRYLSYDQQLVMMWGVLGGTALAGQPLYEQFEKFSMGNWKRDNAVSERVFEYTLVHLAVFLVPLTALVAFLALIFWLVIAPIQDAFCNGYNSVYTLDFLPDFLEFNVCSIRISSWFGGRRR